MVEQIKALCLENGTSIKALEKELGFGNGTIRRWDLSAPSVERIQLVADYFNVSVDYLVGNTEIKNTPPTSEEAEGVSFALYGETKDLSDDEMDEVLNYIRFVKSKRK